MNKDYMLETQGQQLQDIERMRERIRKLSEDKANLYLIQHLMDTLNPTGDIDALLQSLMTGLVECLGGTHVEIYYQDAEQWHYVNLSGQCLEVDQITDPLIKQVLANQTLIEKPSQLEGTLLQNALISEAWDWLIPLVIEKKIIGVIKMSSMLGSAQMRQYLRPFFRHMALILNNQLQTKAANAANQAKSEFLAVISHEIKTPMNAILGTAQLLQNQDLTTPKRQQYVSTILTAGQSLLDLLNDILDITRVEAGKLKLYSEPLDIEVLVQDIFRLFKPAAQKKGLTIQVSLMITEHCQLLGDKKRLKQILSNLVNNAIKFTQQGIITIRVTELECQNDQMLLELAVIDQGIGIPKHKQHLIFQPFVQIDASSTRHFSGTGLGLSIVSRLCQLMNGEVGFESDGVLGACFWVRIPFAISSDAIGLGTIDLPQVENVNCGEMLPTPDIFQLDPVQVQQVQRLVNVLDQMLRDNMFDALDCFSELYELLNGSPLQAKMDVLKALVEQMDFDQAHHVFKTIPFEQVINL